MEGSGVDWREPSRHSFLMRFIHTADWQIGKPFRGFGEKESVLRQARLDGIETIGRLAMRENAPHVLVAGDLYDMRTPRSAPCWNRWSVSAAFRP